jgi:hypothetical protein
MDMGLPEGDFPATVKALGPILESRMPLCGRWQGACNKFGNSLEIISLATTIIMTEHGFSTLLAS